MKKTPITVISNDWHISENNVSQIISLIEEKLSLCKKLGVSEMFVLGDIFTSRKAQSLSCLLGFAEILKMCKEHNVIMNCIPGNHDKTNYYAEDSFLIPFISHSHFRLYSYPSGYIFKGVKFGLYPFFAEDKYLELLEETKKTYNYEDFDVILTHTAFNGSINNDGSKVDSRITPKLFAKNKLVLSGHYHNTQFIKPNIHHLPSIAQNNFGENNDKGFTILYDDFTIEIKKSSFKEYKKIIVDLDKLSSKEIKELALASVDDNKFTRFEFVGNKEKLDHLDTKSLIELGIDVKKKQSEIDIIESESIEIFDSQGIEDEFAIFCQEKEFDFETGMLFLKDRKPVEEELVTLSELTEELLQYMDHKTTLKDLTDIGFKQKCLTFWQHEVKPVKITLLTEGKFGIYDLSTKPIGIASNITELKYYLDTI